jgi:hypothetical protein
VSGVPFCLILLVINSQEWVEAILDPGCGLIILLICLVYVMTSYHPPVPLYYRRYYIMMARTQEGANLATARPELTQSTPLDWSRLCPSLCPRTVSCAQQQALIYGSKALRDLSAPFMSVRKGTNNVHRIIQMNGSVFTVTQLRRSS